MIYASDLDQTLIYSTRSMGAEFDAATMIPAETKQGSVLSYIAIQALHLLKQIAEQALFVPVTTRTVEQYRRIQIFQGLVVPKYAITSNGGNILIEGAVDEAWHSTIFRRVQSECAPSHEVRRLFQEIVSPEWMKGERFCDNLFFAYVIDRERMPKDEVESVAHVLHTMGWETSVQGRKVYLVPRVVSKRDALAHLQAVTGRDVLLASGDSLLDRSMLEFAKQGIAPRHGELYRAHLAQPTSQDPVFTEQSGILAAVEIVQYAANLLTEWRAAGIQNVGRG